jgi:hypothetical protein
MDRTLKAVWQAVGRYRGLMLVNPRRLGRDELRRRLKPALEPVRSKWPPTDDTVAAWLSDRRSERHCACRGGEPLGGESARLKMA